uniref:Uncharacterized protein n=1 Tax=Salix viminalis TaxID=40686 RepID=A0A6N2NAI8_SALVM
MWISLMEATTMDTRRAKEYRMKQPDLDIGQSMEMEPYMLEAVCFPRLPPCLLDSVAAADCPLELPAEVLL